MDHSAEVADLFDSEIIWDAHSGFMPDPAIDLSNLNIWRTAGVNFLSIDVGFDLMPWDRTVATLAAFRAWVLAHPDDYVLAETIDDVLTAKAEKKLAVAFDIEGACALNEKVEMVEVYHRLGVRQLLLAYNRNNAAGSGCHDNDAGLTEFGARVIEEMNRVGMFVDLTHTGYRTSMEAMEHSSKPVIFSHSNAKAVCKHNRNIEDEQIRACARTGGIVGVVGLNRFIGDNRTDSERIADHIEYLVDLIGTRHVGIGLDYAFPGELQGMDELIDQSPQFWPGKDYPAGETRYAEPRQFKEIAEILFRRGYSSRAVSDIMGGNFFRLAAEVWR